MKKLFTFLLLVSLVIGGWYFASPYYALMQLSNAVRDRDMAAIEQRVDMAALRASAADEIARAARERLEEGNVLDGLRNAARDVLERSARGEDITPQGVVDSLLRGNLAAGLAAEDFESGPLDFDIEREGLDHFRAIVIRDDGSLGPSLIFARDGLDWKLTGFALPGPQ